MNFIYELIPGNIIEAIGWAIFHSLWQGALISIVLGIAILIIDSKSAKFRYALSITSLLLLCAASTITFINVYHPQTSVTSVEVIKSNTYTQAETNYFILSTDSPNVLSSMIKEIQKYFSGYLPIIVTLWFAGLLIFSLRFLGGVIYVQRLKTRGIYSLDRNYEKYINSLLERVGIKRLVNVYESALIKVPAAIGYLKPVILFPLGMISGLPQNQVEAIIAHEIAHIKRYDFLVNFLQTLVETIFFYHPSVWWISKISRIERENCCDDIAVELCGDSLTYSKALINIQQMRGHETSFVLAAIGNKNQLFRRIKRMNEKNKTMITYGIKFAAFAVLIFIIAIVSLYSPKSTDSNFSQINKASFLNPFEPLIDDIVVNGNIFDSSDPATPDTTNLKKGKHTFRFYEDTEGDRVRYKAKLNNGKLEQLYVDGEKIPTAELNKYEDKIYNKVDEYEELMSDYRKNRKEYRELMGKYSDKIKENRKKLRDYRNEYRDWNNDYSHEDLSELRESMRELQHELRDNFVNLSFEVPPIVVPEIDVNIPDIHIPPIVMPDIDIDVPDVHVPPIYIDSEDFSAWQDEFKEGMKEFSHSMKNFNFNMDEFKGNMNRFGREMKRFGSFMKDVKEELIDDGIINSGDDIDNFKLSEKEMSVNGKTISPELHKKYLNMYEEHTGKKLEGDKKIVINE